MKIIHAEKLVGSLEEVGVKNRKCGGAEMTGIENSRGALLMERAKAEMEKIAMAAN